LKDLTLGSGLTKIGAQAFAFCKNLESITLPNGVTEIAADAFANSENVKVIYKDKTYDYAHIEDLYNAINGN
ncbi:MAG: leucine-rich repeat domain-containing protein, partial [Oscillospiraceae bacterium]|nr:leucine-rich repeat domain-containing protein [Oscillospiraceae bacterium]